MDVSEALRQTYPIGGGSQIWYFLKTGSWGLDFCGWKLMFKLKSVNPIRREGLHLLFLTIQWVWSESSASCPFLHTNQLSEQPVTGVSTSLLPWFIESFRICLSAFFLVEMFTLIIFRLRSISRIMTSQQEIAKSLKMHHISVWRRSISQASFKFSCSSLNGRKESNLIWFVRFLTRQTLRIWIFKLFEFLSSFFEPEFAHRAVDTVR